MLKNARSSWVNHEELLKKDDRKLHKNHKDHTMLTKFGSQFRKVSHFVSVI